MNTMWRLRWLLGLRQVDVAMATGVSVHRLSVAERGLVALSDAEEQLVTAYLQDRLRIAETPLADAFAKRRCRVTLSEGCSNSHALRLAFRLLDLGIVERGKFTFILFQHDGDCAALRTNSATDCGCDVWAVIDGDSYEFDSSTGEVFVRKAVQQ